MKVRYWLIALLVILVIVAVLYLPKFQDVFFAG